MLRHQRSSIESVTGWLLAAVSMAVLLANAAPAQAASQTALAVPLAGIRLDGDLSDWPRGMPTHPILNHFDVYGRTDLAGEDLTASQDLTPVMMVGYEPNTNLLYLGVEVRDDVSSNPRHPSHLQSDGLEVYVSGLAGNAPGHQPTKYVMVPGVHQFDGFQGSPAMRNGEIGATRTRAVWNRQGDITTYEWQIDVFDRQGQRTDLIPGEVIGLDVVVVDYDGPGSGNPAWVPWGPAIGNKWTGNDRIARVVLGGGPMYGAGMAFDTKDLVRSAFKARLSSANHRGDSDDLKIAVHGITSLVAGVLEGVQEATDDESVIEWMRQEGASEEDLAELRAGLLEAKQELEEARIELRQELIDVDVNVDMTRVEQDILHAVTQANVAEVIARAAEVHALASADAREIHISEMVPPVPPVPPVAREHRIVFESGDSGGTAEIIWGSMMGLAMLIGAVGITVAIARRSGSGKSGDAPKTTDRIERIEQRLTDTQDVMLALSEKLDRLDEKKPKGD
ncbi:MAG: hypothetical protein HN712_21120 [Gemmatimonadetes bacterium]|jgi:hypothetical protein|nr:hypothetical protein [Gemmatimonadota bacterium]MBT6148434.1 hypothetical protein [Gemmatimonadota bacterium]MBT7862830.1 hypothetical protein [Gemmatimonadota bacterium]